MNRLPGYDGYTRRAELALFSSLGVIALVLIGFAVADATNFAVNRDAIIAAVSGEQRASSTGTPVGRTNVAAITSTLETQAQPGRAGSSASTTTM